MAKLLGTLTEPSSSDAVYISKAINMFSAVVTGIDTSIDVRIEFSFDKSNWYNFDESDITITSNDTYNFVINNVSSADYVRFTFVSEVGGTNAEAKIYFNEK